MVMPNQYVLGCALNDLLNDRPEQSREDLDGMDDAELHRLARAADALAQLCYGLAAPRADVLPAVPDGGAS